MRGFVGGKVSGVEATCRSIPDTIASREPMSETTSHCRQAEPVLTLPTSGLGVGALNIVTRFRRLPLGSYFRQGFGIAKWSIISASLSSVVDKARSGNDDENISVSRVVFNVTAIILRSL